ncbi:MAG TPA: hypothetical protein VFR96_06140 [Povalibacter sp.]|jgi:hypothetical protein|nr:hypothetical protein [Povalibacter sp.]
MWFARLFGGRREREEDYEEPTAVAPPAPAPTTTSKPVARPAGAGKPKGFDPYNSGTFERRNAWERVGRR